MNSWVSQVWNDLHFAEPERLYLFSLAVLLLISCFIIWVFRLYRRPEETVGSKYPLIGSIKLWFFMTAALAILIAAWAEPYSDRAGVTIKRGNAEIMFVLDVSSSMFLKDVGMARIDVATREIQKLLSLKILRNEDRAGLIVFGKAAIRRVHLTSDLNNRFAGEVSKIGRPKNLFSNSMLWGSDIVSALKQTSESLDSQDMFAELGEDPSNMATKNWQPKKRSNRLVFLFSDGDYSLNRADYNKDEEYTNDVGLFKKGLNDALSEFKKRGLVIYPVGIGRPEGEKLVDILNDYKHNEYDGSLPHDLEGKVSRLDEENLDYLGISTGGKKFIMTASGADASDFMRRVIDSHRSTTVEPSSSDERQELWVYFLFVALAIFTLAIIL